jgi:hypothetical protein
LNSSKTLIIAQALGRLPKRPLEDTSLAQFRQSRPAVRLTRNLVAALTIHRGQRIARPVLALGVDAPGAGHDKLHDLMVTQDCCDALPALVRDHLMCAVVDRLIPVMQKHDIEGLVMGVAQAGKRRGPPCIRLASTRRRHRGA